MLFFVKKIPQPPLPKGDMPFLPLRRRGQGGFRQTIFIVSVLLSFLVTGCFETIAPDVGPRGTLRFKSNQKEAILEIDETRLGPIGMFEKSGVLLRPGKHRIVVYHKGYFKEYKLVEVIEDELQMVEITMTPIPD